MTKAIIFDFSGTLDNLDEIRPMAVEKAIKEIRENLSPEERLKEAKEIIVEIFRLDMEMQSASIREILFKAIGIKYGDVGQDKLEKIWEIYHRERNTHRDLLESFVKKFPILSGYKLFIITRSREEVIKELLRKHNMESSFHIYKVKKPSLEALKRIIKEHNLEPQECIMIGDDATLDLMPAKMLGMKTILRSSYVDHFIEDFNEIEEFI
jgi:HAD superfamily hydrolase (TIGR01549 family)